MKRHLLALAWLLAALPWLLAALPAAADPRDAFRRPSGPAPGSRSDTAAMVSLGRLLFHETALSGNGRLSCATCHDPLLGFSDGVPRGHGATGRALARRTPPLWNVGWNETFFWDGRARTLEQQALGPIANPDEMGGNLTEASGRLSRAASYRGAFAAAFAGDPAPSPDHVLRALAAYERTLDAPRSRFDDYADGDDGALNWREKAGFWLFTGKAGCSACHSGWTFSDQAFHDIGLPDDDRGRAAVIGGTSAEHAFKTPSLRQTAWTAPYMHDGSVATLAEAVSRYYGGVVPRASLSEDLPRGGLTREEFTEIVAFLKTLSSRDPSAAPYAYAAPAPVSPLPARERSAAAAISQKDRAFSPGAIRVGVGAAVTVFNDDTRTHNIRTDEGADAFNAGEQAPGKSVVVRFAQTGLHMVYCGIHPRMKLEVEVVP